MSTRLDISRDIVAPAELVYAAISDVTRMGEWSEECYACEWHAGFDAPVVGATFDGHNRHGEHEWTTQGKVIEADPGRVFAFECSMMDFHFSTWGYRIEPTERGCRVTEWSENLLPDAALERAVQISGVHDRTERNRRTMSGTLERLSIPREGLARHECLGTPDQRPRPRHFASDRRRYRMI
jgi:uncharacterized protein YndB with AHSA1/START domain